MKGESIEKALFFKSRIMVYTLVVLLISINFIFYLKILHGQQKERSEQMFYQIGQVIEINEKDLSSEREEFSELCIQKADMVSYFVEHEPDVVTDLENIRELAEIMDVDEIHFFNTEGEIYAGTHPQYYGYTVYSGEQMNFFEQMLYDTSLKLCQDIMPNTAEGKEMQYAAVWLSDKSGFVQIGMRPERLLSLMEEKSLQSTVGSIPFEKKEYFHIIDITDGKITASSVSEMVGADFSDEVILSQSRRSPGTVQQLHRNYNGKRFCVYTQQYENYLLIHTYVSRYLAIEAIVSSVILLTGVLLATISVIRLFIRYINRHIVDNLLALNEKLKKIEQGDLEELSIDTRILEFNTLIYYINQLLQSIRFDNKRMLDIVNSGQMPLGVFEYNSFYKKLFLNQWMRNLLGIDWADGESFDTEKDLVLKKIEEIQKNCVDRNQDIYRCEKDGQVMYLKMKKYSDNQSVIYYLDDVSSWWNRIRVIKNDSFKDVLTGLLNRRGMQENAEQCFENPVVMKEAAIVMLDADGLKRINDLYGHSAGDEYLKEIASVLSALPEEHSVSARLGGDEFIIMLYGYDRKEEVDGVIGDLSAMRGTVFTFLRSDLNKKETLEFSMGYSYYPSEGQNYEELMSLADKRMYQEKRKRKSEIIKSDM